MLEDDRVGRAAEIANSGPSGKRQVLQGSAICKEERVQFTRQPGLQMHDQICQNK